MIQQSLFVKNLLTPNGWKSYQQINIEQGRVIAVIDVGMIPDQNWIEYLIPGIPNVHSHGFQYAFRGLAEDFSSPDDSFWSWRKLMYQFVNRISPDDLRVIARALYVDMLKAGYTSVGEFHYLHNDNKGHRYDQASLMSEIMIDTALEVGISICHLPVLYQYGGFNHQPLEKSQLRFKLDNDAYYDLVQNLIQKYLDNRDVNIGLTPHSLRAIDIQNCSELLQQFNENLPRHIHISEQIAEVEQCLDVHHKTPIKLLHEQLTLSPDWNLIHATHANEEEISLIASTGARVGLCLTTEANLGDGFFNLEEFKNQNGHICIGSDSHISVSPVEEIRWMEYGQRLLHKKRAFYASKSKPSTAQNILLESVTQGLKALGFESSSSLIGTKADFISLTPPEKLRYLKSDQILKQWIFSSSTNWINKVMVSGIWVIEEGHHYLDDEIDKNFPKVLQKLLA